MVNAYGAYILRQLEAPIVGLGPGHCGLTALAPGIYIAIDDFPVVVEHCIRQKVDLRPGSAVDMPFEDASVTDLYRCWLLEQLDNPVACLHDGRRVLRCGQ